jgi:hypothetical protein
MNVALFVRAITNESSHYSDAYGHEEARGGTYVEFATPDGAQSFTLEWGPDVPAMGSQWELRHIEGEP